MLKKGDHFTQNAMAQRKAKNNNQHSQSYTQNNKENFSTKGLFQQSQSEMNSKLFKNAQQSNYGSIMVSPTFQTNNIISLKEQMFKQGNANKGFKQVNLSLVDFTQRMDYKEQSKQTKGELKKTQDIAYQKERLLQHYKNKKYWSKIEKLFQQEGVDSVLAWEDSIGKYKIIKQKLQANEVENAQLRNQLESKKERILNLEKQISQQKNQTRVLSQKKCKSCENLQQKEREYFQLYEQSKKQIKQIKQLEEAVSSSSRQFSKMQEKYLQEKGLKEEMQKRRSLLKEQLEKKSLKLQQKEKIQKQLVNELQKLQGEERKNSKLHIQFEQLKELKYQAQKTIGKVEQKSKQKIKQLQQERNIYQNQMNKLRNQLSEIRPKTLKMQLQLESEKSSFIMKINQCDQLKRKHHESMAEQFRKRNQIQNLLKNKDQELNRAYQLIDQAQSIKVKLQFELSHQRKNGEDKDQQLSKYLQVIKELEQKCKQTEEYQCRSKESNQFYNLAKTKNPNTCNPQQAASNSNLTRKIQAKISEIFFKMRDINEDNMDSLQRRKSRDDQIQQREFINNFQLQKYVNYIHSELSRFINKFQYLQKEKDIQRRNTQDQLECKDNELAIMKKQISIKQRVISSLVSFIPEDMKDSALAFLELAEYYSTRDQEENQLDDQFQQMRESLQGQGRAWRQNYQRMKFKFRKIEDDLMRLLQENEQLKRRAKGKQVKKNFTTDYDCYRQGVTKNDIRKKYNFD